MMQPGPFSSPINCSLQHAFLKDNPSFEALSYVWGNAQDTLPIFLDGHVFNVTTNLESALRHLRWEDTIRTFWIDAICINQLDVQERGHQVKFMGEFYRAAERTTVWLGPEGKYTALAFEYILEREALGEMRDLRDTLLALRGQEILFRNELILSSNELIRVREELVRSAEELSPSLKELNLSLEQWELSLEQWELSQEQLKKMLREETNFQQDFRAGTVKVSRQELGQRPKEQKRQYEELKQQCKEQKGQCEELRRRFEEQERSYEEKKQRWEELERRFKQLKAEALQMNVMDQRLTKALGTLQATLQEIHKELEKGGSNHVRASLISGPGKLMLGIQAETPLIFLWQRSPASKSDYAVPMEDEESTSNANAVNGIPVDKIGQKHIEMSIPKDDMLFLGDGGSTPCAASVDGTPVEKVGHGSIDNSPLEEVTLEGTGLELEIDNEVAALVVRDWWYRSWVIQEIAMSRRVIFQCGDVLASWSGIYSVVDHTSADFIQGDFPYVLDVLRMFPKHKSIGQGGKAQEHQMELLDLMQRFRYCEAKDPRDKVYSLLGLASDVNSGDIDIDYTLTPQQVYKDVVRFYLEKHKTLDILGVILEQESNIGKVLPSWVPDWSFTAFHYDDGRPFLQKLASGNSVCKFYHASGDTTMPTNISSNTDHLTLKGFIFDTLADLCAIHFMPDLALFDFNKPSQHLTVIQDWDKKALEVREGLDPYIHTCGRMEAFWRTLIADAIGDERATEAELTAEMFNVWSGRAEAPKEENNFAESFASAVLRASHNRRFSITSNGYMVLAPAGAEEGDLVCVLLGGQPPFILRIEDGHFYLVGACYVHGIMDGEAMEELQTGKYELQDFVIG